MFLICGEALFDVFAEPAPRAPLALTARAGGSPFNVAVGMRRLDARAALFTALAEDAFGRALRAELEAEGVEMGYLLASPHPTALMLVETAADGTPRYRFVGERSADRAIGPADAPTLTEEVTGLHFGSYSAVVEPVAGVHLALARGEARRRVISYDPNVRLGVEPDRALWARRVEEMAALADIVKIGAEDAALLWPDLPFADALARIRAMGAPLTIGTEGAKGARALGAFGEARVAARAVKVVDTVGAGDAFQAAILAEIGARGLGKADIAALGAGEVGEMLRFAAAAASVVCARAGADMPRRAEIARAGVS